MFLMAIKMLNRIVNIRDAINTNSYWTIITVKKVVKAIAKIKIIPYLNMEVNTEKREKVPKFLFKLYMKLFIFLE